MDKPYTITSFTMLKEKHAIITKLKDLGYFPSNSRVIRRCIDIGLPKILREANEITKHIQNNDLISVFDYLKENGFTIYKGIQKKKVKPIVSVLINDKIEAIQ